MTINSFQCKAAAYHCNPIMQHVSLCRYNDGKEKIYVHHEVHSVKGPFLQPRNVPRAESTFEKDESLFPINSNPSNKRFGKF
jgi:hypothetical protein